MLKRTGFFGRGRAGTQPSVQNTEPRMLALEALAMLAQSTKVMSDTIKGLVGSSNRHGDLQVIRTSALRAIEAADVLIREEQREVKPEGKIKLKRP